MTQKFVKGRTHNHLSWVMVDSTDFATPESALSNAIKIAVYGKLRSTSAVYTVKTGISGSVKHVGPSALGIYTFNFQKADLSDASAAWYDQYIVSISATGAAYQTLIVDGGIDESYVSNTLSYLSNVVSYMSAIESDLNSRITKAVATNSQLSDLHSDLRSYLVLMSDVLSDTNSKVGVGNSRVLLIQSDASNIQSMLQSGTFSMAPSLLSDIASRVWSEKWDVHSDASSFGSMFELMASRVSAAAAGTNTSAIAAKVWSDFESKIGSTTSDLFSAITAAGGATTSAIAAKVWSDYGSKVGSTPSQVYSYTSNLLSYLSAVLSDLDSNFQSRVPKAVATNSQLSDLHSDLRSYMGGMSDIISNTYSGVTVLQSRVSSTATTASDLVSKIRSDLESGMGVTFSQLYSVVNAASPTASNIAARVWSDYGSKVGQTPSQVYSYTSNLLSYLSAVLSDFESNFSSRVPKAVATNSQLSDLHSDLRSYLGGMSDVLSDTYAAVSDLHSDFQSRVPKAVATNSQLSDLHSDLRSYLVGMSNSLSDAHSDLASRISGITVSITAADKSDIASQVAVAVGFTPEDIASKVASHFDTVLPGVNIKQVNDIAVDGTGTTADPWGPV
jgi:hypothetical protein